MSMKDTDLAMALAINWLSRCAQDRPLSGKERLEIKRVVEALQAMASNNDEISAADVERAIKLALLWHPYNGGPKYEEVRQRCLHLARVA